MFQVYYMFAVLNYAEFGSWEEVKMNAPQALEEYQQFMKELPADERVRMSRVYRTSLRLTPSTCMCNTRCLFALGQTTHPTACQGHHHQPGLPPEQLRQIPHLKRRLAILLTQGSRAKRTGDLSVVSKTPT